MRTSLETKPLRPEPSGRRHDVLSRWISARLNAALEPTEVTLSQVREGVHMFEVMHLELPQIEHCDRDPANCRSAA